MNRNRDLLFGVLAVQLNKVTPSQLMAAAGPLSVVPKKPLPDQLVARGDMSSNDCNLILGLVDSAIQAHDGDEARALESFGGDEQVQRSFSNVVAYDFGAAARTQPSEAYAGSEILGDLPAVDEAPGRYTHISEFGHGGMGRVLLTHDQHLDRDVALKELLPASSPDDATLQPNTPVRNLMPMVHRFLQEARITGQLEHPSIVPVYETGRRKDGRLYYTMKLVRGKTLSAALKACGSLEARLAYVSHYLDLCQAIAYAHDRHVIHRDIKPENVMIGDFGETVVIDWGLAKVMDKEDVHRDALQQSIHAMQSGEPNAGTQTQHGEALGTPIYMPPEQARGDIDKVDERSDVYSLGAVLYELLTGEAPFDGEDAKDILAQVMSRPPKPIREYVRDAPPELVAICERAMAQESSKRYATAKELAGEIERYQSGALVLAYNYKFSEHLKRFAGRNKRILATAAAGLVALVAVAGISHIRIRYERNYAVAARNDAVLARDREKQLRETAEKELYLSCITLARECASFHRYDAAVQALDRAPEALRGWEWAYYNRLCHLDEHTLAGHQASVTWAEYSPDGSRILTSSHDATAKIWDAETGALLLTLIGHSGSIEIAHFSRNGARIVTASADHTARIWDTASGKELFTLSGHENDLRSADFNFDGTRIVTTSSDHTAKIWDTASGKELLTLKGHSRGVISAVFAPDGARVVTLSLEATARVWDATTGQQLLSLPDRGGARGAAYSPDGKRLFTWSSNPVAHIWDADSGQELTELRGVGATIRWATLSPDGTRVLEVFSDGQVKMYNSQDGAELLALTDKGSPAAAAQFSGDGMRVAVVLANKAVIVKDAKTGQTLGSLEGHWGDVNSARFSPDGSHVVTASVDETAKVWNVREFGMPELHKLKGHSETVFAIIPNRDGSRILTCSKDKAAKLWDVNAGREVFTLIGPGYLESARFSPDESRIVTAYYEGHAIVWDAGSGQSLLKFGGQTAHASSAEYSPDGRLIVVLYDDKTAKVWDAATGAEVSTLSGHTNGLTAAHFSPDGRFVLTCSADSTARLWDPVSGTERLKLTGHTAPVSFAAFTPDGARILTASDDNTTRLWDAATAKQMLVWQGNRYGVDGAVFSPDGQSVAIYSAGDKVKVWDLNAGKELLALSTFDRAVWKLAFSPDGQRVLTMGVDGVVRVWDVVSGSEMAEIPSDTVATYNIGAMAISAGGKNLFTASGNDIHIWQGF